MTFCSSRNFVISLQRIAKQKSIFAGIAIVVPPSAFELKPNAFIEKPSYEVRLANFQQHGGGVGGPGFGQDLPNQGGPDSLSLPTVVNHNVFYLPLLWQTARNQESMDRRFCKIVRGDECHPLWAIG